MLFSAPDESRPYRMYRYSVDNAVTYTPDDFVLFRESPFAAWMERLTLENPDHGIPPDIKSVEPSHSAQGDSELVYGDIVDTLRAEARDVALISAGLDEPSRRAGTLAAMRDGADFIVNGLLALGPLCGSANLLMRTSGYSELGDYLYVPCETKATTTLHSAFRLSFLADLLHSLQGQLPPQMLIIRGDADVVPLHTEDHIYYYRALKKRFMDDMRNFRKHRMPDPTDSAHFGRWAECASEVLKQRAQSEGAESDQPLDDIEERAQLPELQVAGLAGQTAPAYKLNDMQQPVVAQGSQPGAGLYSVRSEQTAAMASHTLAEQARSLDPGSYRAGAGPGPTPNLARFAQRRPVAVESKVEPEPEPAKPELDLVELESPEPESVELDLVALEPITTEDASLELGLVDIELLETGQLATDSLEPALSEPQPDCLGVDVALQNLEFIGSNSGTSLAMDRVPQMTEDEALSHAPPPTLRETRFSQTDTATNTVTGQLPDLEPPEPFLLPPDDVLIADEPPRRSKSHPLDSDGFSLGTASVVDMDGAPPPTLAPVVESIERNTSDKTAFLNPARRKSDPILKGADPDDVRSPTRAFSSSLITSADIEDY
jgi:hypothetical protein